MDLFSSNSEETIKRTLTCIYNATTISSEEELVEIFDLHRCLQFVRDQKFLKVCLQFPDNLLQFSVRITLWLERHLDQKVYILGDTSYGSCCVDELAAEHIGADAVIHMGHACLSPTRRLPVLYILPRASLDVSQFTSELRTHCSKSTGPVLLLYDVAYSHSFAELRSSVVRECGDQVVVSQLCTPGSEPQPCSPACTGSHETRLLGRSYCCHSPASVVYLTDGHSQNMINFALSLRDVEFFSYTGGKLQPVDCNRTLRRRLFLVEKVKDAKTLGILVGTLSVDKFLGAIDRVKKLAKYRGKRCYVFSVGKPNPAKLANFPEIEVFVMVSCPESCLEDDKQYLQPVVTLLEAELALNSNRQWNDNMSVDFRDLVEDGCHYQPLPEGQEPLAPDVSLIDNRMRSDLELDDAGQSTQLSLRDHYQISVASSYTNNRSWRGLEQALGETPVAQVKKGRSGIPLGYDEERLHHT